MIFWYSAIPHLSGISEARADYGHQHIGTGMAWWCEVSTNTDLPYSLVSSSNNLCATQLSSCFALCKYPCLVGRCGKIFAIFVKFASIANFYGPPHCFALCPVGDCGKIVIFAIFAKFASIANFYGPPHCFVLCFVLCPVAPIVVKLSFSPYFPDLPTCSLFCHFCCCVHFWTYLPSFTLQKLARWSLFPRVTYNVAPIPGGLTAPSVTIQSKSSGFGRVIVRLLDNASCASLNTALRSSDQEMASLDCRPATMSSSGTINLEQFDLQIHPRIVVEVGLTTVLDEDRRMSHW